MPVCAGPDSSLTDCTVHFCLDYNRSISPDLEPGETILDQLGYFSFVDTHPQAGQPGACSGQTVAPTYEQNDELVMISRPSTLVATQFGCIRLSNGGRVAVTL